MRGEVITLDVETTGLDPNVDKIIEVAILRSQGDTVLDEYHTLLNPGIAIPPKITQLTGISDEDVRNAPRIWEVVGEIRDFIGNLPVIGHKVDFDLGMLDRYDIGRENPAIDTYELASFLLPTAPRYSLSSLAEEMGLDQENAHRAMDDTRAAWQLYRKLWQQVLALPINLLREIVDHATDLDWNAKPVLLDALRMRVDAGEVITGRMNFDKAFYPGDFEGERLRPYDRRRDIDAAEIAAALSPGGSLAQKMPGYESRQSQVEMLRAVATAFNTGDHLIIEAPTGTGKSLAYLLPAAQWAVTNNERVVIATNTINLQDQLLEKDIPLIQGPLGLNLNAAILKGRSNYLCPRRLDILRRRKPTNVDELRVLAKVLVWLHQQGDGVRTDLNLRGGVENAIFNRISAQDEGCTTDRCRSQMRGVCPFYKARQQAERAHLLIVNHALLLSDVATGSRVLPEYRYLVLDEAHHLEDAITKGLSRQVDKFGFARMLSDLGDSKKGLLGSLLKSLEGLPSEYYEKFRDRVDTIVIALGQAGEIARVLFDELAATLGKSSEDRSDYYLQVRVTDQVRNRRDWQRVQSHWGILSEFTDILAKSMLNIAEALTQLKRFAEDIDDYENLVVGVGSAGTRLQESHRLLEEFVENPDANMIYWVEIGLTSTNAPVAINAAPLHVGALVQEHIWEDKEAVVLTSATLRTAGRFDFLAERLHAIEVTHKSLPSPFDYEESTLLYLPTDIPEPRNKKQYQEMVERGIIELATVTQGRMLVLFTSYHQLRETAQAVAPRLALGNIVVYDQTSGSSRQMLLESFRSTEKAVLMGARSFWEGVDVPGDDLSVVVIVRLPFAVPSDPIFAARSETFGETAFYDYSVPDAILRFRQGFGRLIRRKDDRGIVVIMDNRIISKGYGRLFLESLPRTTLRRGKMEQLPRLAADWLKK